MLDSETGLSTEMAVGMAKKFLRTISQPLPPTPDGKKKDSWSLRELEKHQQELRQMKRDVEEAGHGAEDVEMGIDEYYGGADVEVAAVNGDGLDGTGHQGALDEYDEGIDEDLMNMEMAQRA